MYSIPILIFAKELDLQKSLIGGITLWKRESNHEKLKIYAFNNFPTDI